MKWFALLSCCIIAVAFNACEKHDASELKKIEESAEHGDSKAATAKEHESAKAAPEKK